MVELENHADIAEAPGLLEGDLAAATYRGCWESYLPSTP
jgi:hypothetical protein